MTSGWTRDSYWRIEPAGFGWRYSIYAVTIVHMRPAIGPLIRTGRRPWRQWAINACLDRL